ncbi:hypothetical protein SAMN05216392_0342 [Streptococcus equinus]|uniref:DUF5067 domain-containing protein n=1 Tax=Streptococcus equinus TaxID=1335 RepID=A0A1H0Y0M4_STREI|nr:hypothetical protein [Streptococcus equinus]QBX24839.1 hypothetical protein Javan214_0002 [Streptococcus phage Javan214]SDQ08678.1 hypothetical protein SAMN05216392_0342 [Streptococcus equinus]
MEKKNDKVIAVIVGICLLALLIITSIATSGSSKKEKTTKKNDDSVTQVLQKSNKLSFDDSYIFTKADDKKTELDLAGLKVTVKQPYISLAAYSDAGYDSYDEFIDYYPEFKGKKVLLVPIKLKNTTAHYIDTPRCIVVDDNNSPLEYSYIDGISKEIDGLEAGEEAKTVDVYVANSFDPVFVTFGNKLWK